ncbi:MAG: MlaD family protein [bacterium]
MKERNLERKVGAFVLIGLIVIGMLVVAFGRFNQFFKSTYDVVAEFPNASGIIKNSQVLYRGAKVGSVPEAPHIANQGKSVEIILRINHDVHIPKNADVRIGLYGLLGDRFVDIVPPKPTNGEPAKEAGYLGGGDHVKGLENKGVADLLATAEQKLQNFDHVIRELQAKLLTDEFIDDFHAGMKNAREMLEKADHFMGQAEAGKGPIYTLMKDKSVAKDLKDFIHNVRVSGPVFYKDVSKEEEDGKKKQERVGLPKR